MKNGVFWDVTPCGSYKNRRLRDSVTWRAMPAVVQLLVGPCRQGQKVESRLRETPWPPSLGVEHGADLTP
jgi:hypothetical protein